MKHFVLSFIAAISLSVSLSADTNSMCSVYAPQAIEIAKQALDVATSINKSIDSAVQVASNLLSKLSVEFIAIVAVVSSASCAFTVLAMIAIWKCAGNNFDHLRHAANDIHTGAMIREYYRLHPMDPNAPTAPIN